MMTSPNSRMAASVCRLYMAMGCPNISRYCFGMSACAEAFRRSCAAAVASQHAHVCQDFRRGVHPHALAHAPSQQDKARCAWIQPHALRQFTALPVLSPGSRLSRRLALHARKPLTVRGSVLAACDLVSRDCLQC